VSQRFRGKLCIYCLSNTSTSTGDHVFARAFFPESERADLPKVSACERCNSEKSKLERYLTAVPPFGGRRADALANLQGLAPPRLPSAPGKQNGPCLGVGGTAIASKSSLRGVAPHPPLPPVAQTENRGFGMPPMPATAGSQLLFALLLLPPVSPTFAWRRESKNGPEGPF
jgi:hypothetical protein